MKLNHNTFMFFINQSYTWSRMCISEEHFRRLFTRLAVHPSFLDIVYLFGAKVGPVEESFSSLFVDISPQPLHSRQTPTSEDCSYYIGYNIKYVARHGRAFPTDPFSIRETGVYQNFSSSNQESSWVFLQASGYLQKRLMGAFRLCDDTLPSKQFLLHAIILLDAAETWREYLIYLEDEFSKVADKGFFTNVKGPQLEGDMTADFTDLRRLHILTDKLRRVRLILNMNTRVGHGLKKGMARIDQASSPALHTHFDWLQAKLDKFLLGLHVSLERIDTLIVRAVGIGQLVQSIQDIRSAEASKQINDEMQKLTEQGVKENKLMKRLTEQSTRDTRSMMTVALISAIFLPATFFAVSIS
ncbi:hypothetical protein GQ44DRAFT_463058 [Phaeosphaeriaceae sp. PMI808]|nr:hypothetical protein GQ44DRAFT_463058 [Phaeosphaeriaceae sp. PMI808]